jgi:hypothetical protein
METDELAWEEHVPQELWERYSMGRVSEGEELERIETHLLVCSLCQQVLKEIDDSIAALREAARQLPEEAPRLHIVPRGPRWRGPPGSKPRARPGPTRERENLVLGRPEPWPEVLRVYQKARAEALDAATSDSEKMTIENQYEHRVNMLTDNQRFNRDWEIEP